MAEAWAAGIKYSLDITDGKRPAPTIPHQAHEEFDRFLDKLEVSTSEKEPQPGQQADDGGVGLEEGSHGGSGVDVMDMRILPSNSQPKKNTIATDYSQD